MQDLIDKENARISARVKRQEEIFAKRDAAIAAAHDEAMKALLALADEDAKAVDDFSKEWRGRLEKEETAAVVGALKKVPLGQAKKG